MQSEMEELKKRISCLEEKNEKISDSIDQMKIAMLGDEKLGIRGFIEDIKDFRRVFIQYKYLRWLIWLGAATASGIAGVLYFLKDFFSKQ